MVIPTILHQLLLKNSIGQMSTVPCEKIIHPVNNHKRQMGCVRISLRGQSEQLDDVGLKQMQILWNGKLGNALQVGKPSPGCGTVSARTFVHGKCGCEQAIKRPLLVPPIVSGCLVDGDGWLAARMSGQVAGDGRLNVNGLHCSRLPRQCGSVEWTLNAGYKPQPISPGGFIARFRSLFFETGE